PPSESYLNLSAFAYAKEVIITVETHFLSMYGLKQLFETINFIKKKLNPSLNILGILPTKVYRKTNMHKETLNVLKSRFEDLILPVSIDFTIKHAYASMCGKPLVVIDPKHRSSVSYKNLAKLIINQ
ncbi:MAG: ParA family protein, partial [Endomicrobium sp.]|nr:ParA family protein [Endomicrobium sp.]